MKTEPLGKRMHTRGISMTATDHMGNVRWKEFIDSMTLALGMNKAAEPAIWFYPQNGKGGTGHTICQPITESFICLDTWPTHRGAYLMICSCKPISGANVHAVCKEYGIEIANEFGTSLGIPE